MGKLKEKNRMDSCYDVIIIGAGILGCFAARALRRYKLDIAVLEKKEDVCTGITRANTGIIYQGYDQHPGSLKAGLCVKASEEFPFLCRELDVPYRKSGLMMLSFGPNADRVLKNKIEQGRLNGAGRVSLLKPDEIYRMEPNLCRGIEHALYAEDTYVVNPWELGIAAYENAAANGADFFFNKEVTEISKENGSFILRTGTETYRARRVLCCGGFDSDRLWEMLSKPEVRLVPQAADYIIFDTKAGDMVSHVISVEPEEKGEGLTVVPTVDGNIMAGPTRRDLLGKADYSTEKAGIDELIEKCSRLIPEMPMDMIIRSFGAARPNPYYVNEDGSLSSKSVNDFLILEEDGFFCMIGVKTPGITCSGKLGEYITERIIATFASSVEKNEKFDPFRKGIMRLDSLPDEQIAELCMEDPSSLEIICRCRHVSKAEVMEAIRRGAVTINGVKRRTGAGMGRCQGGYCARKILHLLSETLGKDIYDITLDGEDSCFLGSPEKTKNRQ